MAGMHAEENLFARSRVLFVDVGLLPDVALRFSCRDLWGHDHRNVGASFIAAVGFNVIVPAIYLILKLYYLMYLFGYNESHFQNIDDLSPAIKSVAYNPIGLKWASSIWQSQRSSSLSACSSITRESWNGRRTVWCLSRLMCSSRCSSDFSMSLLGFAFHTIFEESQGITVFGYICGALLAMIIVRMIIMKTVRVFDKPFLKTAVAYLVAALVFFAVIVFDLTGFESRVRIPRKSIRWKSPVRRSTR